MRYAITALFTLLIMVLNAQEFNDKGTVWLIGDVKNAGAGFFEFAGSGFFDNRFSSVLFNKDGRFTHKLEIEGSQQDLYLKLDDNFIQFTVQDGDSLLMRWDEKNFRNSFQITGTQQRQQLLWSWQWSQFLNFREPFIEMVKTLGKKRQQMGDDEMFLLINNLYHKELTALMGKVDSTGLLLKTAFPDLFYKYTAILWEKKLLPKYQIQGDIPINNKHLEGRMTGLRYSDLDLALFWTSATYRDFLYDFLKSANRLIFDYSFVSVPERNPVSDQYHMAWSVLKIPRIRDWFITKCVLDGFSSSEFDKVEPVYNRFQEELKDTALKSMLVQGYMAATTLKPGKMPPAFILKNASGRNVSLADFKGKVVYLDFWGVNCGPCIYDITNYGPKLHLKYQEKDVAFVSVCIDGKEKQWKDALKKYKMEGTINLIAEGQPHPVMKAYNVTSIPHYYVIGKDGTIVDNNAPAMGELLGNDKNVLDQALER